MKSIDDFQPSCFDEPGNLCRLGTGTIGGKANGLVFINEVLKERFGSNSPSEISVEIPWMVVLGADCFTAFMEQNDLFETVFADLPDYRIAHAFLRATLPVEITGGLRTIAEKVQIPLAVRSSSLLEDALYRPFAGVYSTKMIPNNQPSPDERYRKLAEAVKLVYASTYFKGAKSYIQSIGEDSSAEKMAVIIQRVVGRRFSNRYYPNVSGVARSFNYYPFGHARFEDGVVDLALGLGKTIVDGGRTWSFCPAYPKSPPPYNNTGDLMKNTQTEFWAVNMGEPPEYDPIRETEYLILAGLDDADYDNTLKMTASTYDPGSDRLIPGVGRDGPRALNFAPILQLGDIPLNDTVNRLLSVSVEALKSEVEIEFALTFDPASGRNAELGFLQVRPMVVAGDGSCVSLKNLDGDHVIVATERALGSSSDAKIEDIVYVRPEVFAPKHTAEIPMELESINASLAGERRPYLLIGFGRWGTSDPWRGIPVTWDQISWARAIVEASFEGMETDFSQGSHFFHNLTSFKVSYFSITGGGRHKLDMEWIASQPEVAGTRFVRHVRTPEPLAVRVDSRSARGVILKP